MNGGSSLLGLQRALPRRVLDRLNALNERSNSKKNDNILIFFTYFIHNNNNWIHFSLPISTGSMYVRNYFNEGSREIVNNMAAEIREEILNKLEGMQVSQSKQNISLAKEISNDIGINTSDWSHLSADDIEYLLSHVTNMDVDEEDRSENQTAQSAAISKVKAMKYYIAHHNGLLDNDLLENYYAGLELDSDSLLHSVLNIRKFNKDHEMDKLRKAVNTSDWEIGSTMAIEADAVYSSHLNSFCEFSSRSSKSSLS